MVKKNKKQNIKKKKEVEKGNLMNTIIIIILGIYSLAKAVGMWPISGPSLKISGNTTTNTLNIEDVPTYQNNKEALSKGAEIGSIYMVKVKSQYNALAIVTANS